MPSPPPLKRPFQFRLRTLMIWVTISSILFAISSWAWQQLQQKYYEAQTISFIRENGGIVYLHPDRVHQQNLAAVQKVIIRRQSPTNHLPLVANMPNLEALVLWGTNVKDLSVLANLTSLQELQLGETQVDDLSPLTKLTNLEILLLQETKVTDLTDLSGLKNLNTLHLRGTSVSDLSPLAGLTNLKKLGLFGTPVSDEQLQMTRQALPNCEIYPPWGHFDKPLPKQTSPPVPTSP